MFILNFIHKKKGKIKLISILIIVTFSLQSCFVAKDYKRPELKELSDDLYRTDKLPQDSLSIAEISWRELFTDSFLVSYVEEALENNIDIRIAIQRVTAANAYYKQGKAGYLPEMGARVQVTHQELSGNSQFGTFFDGGITQYELTGNLSWEMDIWGKIRSNRRA